MFKFIIAVLALVVIANGQSTQDCPENSYCYFIDGNLFAYLNITREPCNDIWEYKLIRPLENGNEFIIGSGTFYYYYWTVTNTFGAGTGFLVYFSLNEISTKNHYNELTFKYSTLTIPSISSEQMKFNQKFSITINDTCRTNQETKKQCHAPLNFDYDFAESENSFYNLQGYVPGASPALKPFVSQDNCVYIINQADNSNPKHLAPIFCYDPKLFVCTLGYPLAVQSRSGFAINQRLDYTLNSVTIQIDDELSLDAEFNNPWVQAPTTDRLSFIAGFNVAITLYNTDGFVNAVSLSQDFNFPLCGTSSSSCNSHHESSWGSSFTSFFTSFFTSWSSSSFFTSWSSSSFFTSWSSSSWSSTSVRTSAKSSSGDGAILLWLLGSVFLFLTVLVVGAVVGVLVFFKKSQYHPIVISPEGDAYYPSKGVIN